MADASDRPRFHVHLHTEKSKVETANVGGHIVLWHPSSKDLENITALFPDRSVHLHMQYPDTAEDDRVTALFRADRIYVYASHLDAMETHPKRLTTFLGALVSNFAMRKVVPTPVPNPTELYFAVWADLRRDARGGRVTLAPDKYKQRWIF